jgi:hypothetical protein
MRIIDEEKERKHFFFLKIKKKTRGKRGKKWINRYNKREKLKNEKVRNFF